MAAIEVLDLVVGDPDLEHQTECPACGFDAVIRFPVYALTALGVALLPETWAACLRCWCENHPDDCDEET